MTDKDEKLMQQALEALEKDQYDMVPDKEGHMVFRKEAAIKALQKRLAHCDRCGKKLGGPDHIHTCSPQVQEPNGWRLVPVEPTQEMLCATEVGPVNLPLFCWIAMLSAAPNPPQRKPEYKVFLEWAANNGFDAAYTVNSDTGEFIALNPQTADLWKAWQAAHGIKGEA